MCTTPPDWRPVWDELPLLIDLDAATILRATIYAPGGDDTVMLAQYLDRRRCPGILKRYVETLVKESRTLLEEALSFEESVRQIFLDPCGYFKTDQLDALRTCFQACFKGLVHIESPDHVKLAMTAHIEFAIGDLDCAARQALFAQCAKQDPSFHERMESRRRDKDLGDLMAAVERPAADKLVELIRQYRIA